MLNIILVVGISEIVTFMITSKYCNNKLADAGKFLSEETKEGQDKLIKSILEDDFDPDSEKAKKHYANLKTMKLTYIYIYIDV